MTQIKRRAFCEKEKQRLKWKKASCMRWCSGVKAMTSVYRHWKDR
ncbi:hypothetical protein LEMLEM_LOCUS24028 [Lemmus lemmus]